MKIKSLLAGAALLLIGVATLKCTIFSRFNSLEAFFDRFESAEQIAQEHGDAETGFYKQWFEAHKDENGEIPSGLLQEWLNADKLQRGKSLTSAIGTVENLKSPTVQQGGRTRSILIDETDDNKVWAGCVSGGLFRSIDMGDSWQPVNDANTSLGVTCLAQNPLNTQQIFYGTGEWRGASGPSGDGVWRSDDGGVTFSQIPSSATVADMNFCNEIKHSKTDVNTLFVGTSNGLYRTTNDGTTWQKVQAGNVSGLLTFNDGSVVVTNAGGTMYRSTTGVLNTFTRIGAAQFPSGNAIGLVCLENCRDYPNIVYAWFTNQDYNGDAHNALFKSRNSGQTWQKITCSPTVGSGYQSYNGVIGVAPTDTNQVFIAAVTAATSYDGGNSWDLTTDYGHADNHVVAYFTNEPTWFLLGNDGGVYKTSWDGAYTLTNSSVNYITFQFYAGDYGRWGKWAVGGAQDNGTWRYRSTNNTPVTKIGGADGGYSFISRQDSTLAYYSFQEGDIYRITTLTNNITSGAVNITPPYRSSETADFINEFQINPADGKQLYVRTSQGIWRTANRGTTWTRLNDTTNNIGSIASLAVTNEADPTVYLFGRNTFIALPNAATATPYITHTNNYLKMPSLIRTDAPGEITIDPQDNNTIYYGYTTYSSQPRAWKVTDANSATPIWTNISGNLPSKLPVYQIVRDPQELNTFYAATDFGLYFTYDGGTTWSKETRVPNVPIFNLKIRADGALFAFTHGRGIWYLRINYTATQNIASPLKLTAFPNPTTQNITLQYENLTLSGNNQIDVFNAAGQNVLSKNPDAISETILDVQNLPAGTYFARLQTKDKTVTKKFVISH